MSISTFIDNISNSRSIILILGLFTILPFFVVSVYNNPMTDDFCYHNISQNLGYLDAQQYFYNYWNGRFITTSILTIKALLTGSFIFYKIVPIITLSLLIYSIYKLSSVLFVKSTQLDKLVLCCYLMVLYLAQAPNISEAFYWLSSTTAYQFANISTILFLYFLIRFLDKKKKYLLIPLTFLLICIVGLNEISMLIVDFILACIIISNAITQKKVDYSLIGLLLVAIVFSIIVYVAPGNFVRGNNYPDQHQFDSVFNSVYALLAYLYRWLPLIILCSFLYFNYFSQRNIQLNETLLNINPFVIFIVSSAILFVGFFTGFWAMGKSPPTRAINTIYFNFLVCIVFLCFAIYYQLKKSDSEFIRFTKWVRYLVLILVLVRLVDNEKINNIKLVYSDLISGRASKYNFELNERYEFIRNNNESEIHVPKLKNTPKTIYSSDLTDNPNHWINKCYSTYFGIESVQTVDQLGN